jgi:hypothetical protein
MEVRTTGKEPTRFGVSSINWPDGTQTAATIDLSTGPCFNNWCLQNALPGGGAVTSTRLTAVWGSDTHNIWATGGDGTILKYDGIQWSNACMTATLNQPKRALYAIFGTSSNSIWAVGQAGTIFYYDGGLCWTIQPTAVSSDLRGVWSSDNSNAWAVGDSGTILHFQSGSWNVAPESGVATIASLAAVRGCNTCAGDIWAVGDAGTILGYNGTTWTKSAQSGQVTANLLSLWLNSDRSGWASGFGPTFLTLKGGQWMATTPDTQVIGKASLWASSPTSVWGVGYQGQIARYQGTGWSNVAGLDGLGQIELTGIWGVGPNDIWAVGNCGRILKYGQ